MKYGLIGEKLSHSYSKVIHEMITGTEYDIMPVPRDELDSFMKAKAFDGINVPLRQSLLFLSISMPEVYTSYITKKLRAASHMRMPLRIMTMPTLSSIQLLLVCFQM